MSVVLAVDGGNSKTYLALVGGDGSLLSLVRGPLSSPHHLGVDGCLGVLESLFSRAVAEAGLADSPALSLALPNAYFDSLGIPRLTVKPIA